ncbi:MAG: hypothetical protein ACREXR_18280, partial [Gammaproteobacteria bacterium]
TAVWAATPIVSVGNGCVTISKCVRIERPDIYAQSFLFAIHGSHLANRVESIYTVGWNMRIRD